jgi:uncharacterized protein YecE (DUF72 family)
MAIWVGTSGYQYPEWKGSFYPEKLPAAKMLPYYAERLATVEINYTFYRTPNKEILQGWDHATPERFRLTLKAPQRITHIARLRDCAERLHFFLETAAPGVVAAFEFRNRSWLDEEVYARLKARNLALCVADSEKLTTPVRITADYGYFRLRDEGYQPEDIKRWAHTVRDQTSGCKDVYVYFKHEESGKGPEFARAFMEVL